MLVHSGGADAGHYYSYVKERVPLDAHGRTECKWFEFNDTVVSPFDPKDLPTECFGGTQVCLVLLFIPLGSNPLGQLAATICEKNL